VLTLSALLLATVLGAPTPAPEPSGSAAGITMPRDPFDTGDGAALRPVPVPERRQRELRDPFRPDPARRPVAGASRQASQLRDPFTRDPARRPRAIPMRATEDVHSPFAPGPLRPPATTPVRDESPCSDELVDPFARAR
jgi:hypothetical protein